MPYVLGTNTAAKCIDIIKDEPMNLHIISRNITQPSMIIPLIPGFTIHSVSAFETKENTLVLYTSAWKSETISSGQVKGGLLGSWSGTAPIFDDIPLTLLYKTVVDLSQKMLLSHAPVKGMETTVIEHPHIRPDLEGSSARYMYMSMGSLEGLSSPPLGYLRLDTITGEQQRWFAPLHTYCEEIVIVPKTTSQDGNEDDVWLLAMMFDGQKDKSCLGIFDGRDVSTGPVARVWLTHRLPHSLHGYFTRDVFN
jgi:all-trans-8'-apo-beta-carotenal 15,15'-oxygenase